MWCAVARTEMSRGIEPGWSLSSFRSLVRQAALSTVAVGFEPCSPGAFSVGASEHCRPATGLCGVCAGRPAFQSAPRAPSTHITARIADHAYHSTRSTARRLVLACRLLAGSCLRARVCRLLAGSCLQAPRSHSVAVYGVVGIRPEAGSLRPNEGVAERHSVFLVVPRAGRVRPGLLIPLVASGSQSAPMVALSVSNAVQV